MTELLNKPSNTVEIDVNLIPTHVRDDLTAFALSLTEDCFSQPGAERRYKKWLKEYKRRSSVGKDE